MDEGEGKDGGSCFSSVMSFKFWEAFKEGLTAGTELGSGGTCGVSNLGLRSIGTTGIPNSFGFLGDALSDSSPLNDSRFCFLFSMDKDPSVVTGAPGNGGCGPTAYGTGLAGRALFFRGVGTGDGVGRMSVGGIRGGSCVLLEDMLNCFLLPPGFRDVSLSRLFWAEGRRTAVDLYQYNNISQ